MDMEKESVGGLAALERIAEELASIVEDARGYVADREQGEMGYGFFPGGDPRNFTPDSDSTEEERANHKRACEAADSGQVHMDSDGQWVGEGDMVAHITICQFGLGVYTMPDPVAGKFLDKMEDALKRFRALQAPQGAQPNTHVTKD